ncbi:MAG TPA: hypothetical protein VIS76_12845 [Pseudomonadales bacterium]
MNNRLPARTHPRALRWLAVAGAVIGLSAPLAAKADHRDNDAMEVLASAAIAYVVIDAAGGFKDGHKHRRHHRRHDHFPGCGHHGYGHDGYRQHPHAWGWAPQRGHHPAPPRYHSPHWFGYQYSHGERDGRQDRDWHDRGRGRGHDRHHDHEYRYRQRAYH